LTDNGEYDSSFTPTVALFDFFLSQARQTKEQTTARARPDTTAITITIIKAGPSLDEK